MKNRALGTIAVLFSLALIVSLSGCMMTRAELERGIRANRANSYESWQREHEKGTEGIIRVDRPLSVAECVRIALENNREIQILLQEKEKAQGKITEAWSGALPKLDVAAGYTRLDEVASFDIAGRTVSLGDENNYSAELTLRQPLYQGGVVSAGLRAAKIFRYLADERVRNEVQNTIYSVRRKYYNILLFQELAGVSSQAASLAKAHLKDVKLKKNQGLASEFDVLRVEVDVSNFEAEMIQRQNASGESLFAENSGYFPGKSGRVE